MNASGQQYPPPRRYDPPELRNQLRGSARVLILVAGLVNLLSGVWLWRVLRGGQVGSDITAVLGMVGLVLVDLVCAGLVLYARRRR